MRPDDNTGRYDGPRVVVHVFEVAGGIVRPSKTLKANKDDLEVALSARRSHRKSRAGCERCKTRRVKCGEEKPNCMNCVRKGDDCVYPNVSSNASFAKPKASTKAVMRISDRSQNMPTAFPSMTSDTFTMQDMRFFHHFLIKAKPHMPVGNDAVWTRDIPQLAHNNTFLLYSMLALGSTHLGRLLDCDSYKIQSLTYRVRGLDGLRKAVARVEWRHGDADSLIAAGYALMQQSGHLEDAVFEWMSLLRLIYSIMSQIARSQHIVTEFDIRPAKHIEYISPYLHLLPSIDATLLREGIEELESVRPILTNRMVTDFHHRIIHCLEEHQKSPSQGYFVFGSLFGFWFDLPDNQFAEFIDPRQGEFQLLLFHFMALFIMMVPLSVIENHQSLEYSTPRHILGIFGWARNLSSNIPQRLKKYSHFPEAVIATARAEINGIPVSGPSVLQLPAAHTIAKQISVMRPKHSRPKQSLVEAPEEEIPR